MLPTNKVCSPWISRLGYTYLRLKDNHMEILNKDDEIERLVVTTGFDITDITLQIVVQRDAQANLPYEDSVSSVGSKLWCRESDHVSSLSLSSLRWPVDGLLF